MNSLRSAGNAAGVDNLQKHKSPQDLRLLTVFSFISDILILHSLTLIMLCPDRRFFFFSLSKECRASRDYL